MVDINIELKGLALLERKLKKMPDTIAKAQHKAMQRTARKGRDAARTEAQKVFDNPRPQTIKAIENKWPSVQKIKSGKGDAAVFIKDFLADEIYPSVFQVRETRVPKSSKTIVEPTRHARRNKFGNVPGLRSGKLQRLRGNEDKYLSVPIGSRAPQTRHLKPGLYQILGGRSRNKVRSGQKSRAKLIMLFAYTEDRVSKPVFKRYPKVVRVAYREHYGTEFFRALRDELAANNRGR